MDNSFTLLRNRLEPHYGEREARAVAFLVLEEAFGVSRTEVYADKVRHFSEDEYERLLNICELLEQGEPVQYVLGSAWFGGRKFEVDRSTLIPRPETEELVEWAVAELRRMQAEGAQSLKVLDAGTGSGCIAISIKFAVPEADVWAWDISEEALAVARRNAERLGAEVHFRQCDMLEPWTDDGFALVVSNPPYVRESERAEMERHVTDYEPEQALFVPDDDPQRFYRAIADQTAVHGALLPRGVLLAEVNAALAGDTAMVFAEAGLQAVEIRRDTYGRERMVGGWMKDRIQGRNASDSGSRNQ